MERVKFYIFLLISISIIIFSIPLILEFFYFREIFLRNEFAKYSSLEFFEFLQKKSLEDIIDYFKTSPEIEFIYSNNLKKIFSENPYLDFDNKKLSEFLKKNKSIDVVNSNTFIFRLRKGNNEYLFIKSLPYVTWTDTKVIFIRTFIIFLWGLIFLLLISIILRPFRYIKELTPEKLFEGIIDRKTIEYLKKKEMEKNLFFLGQISSILIHEINNIAASLLTTLKVIKIERKNEEIEEILKKIENKIFELKNLLNEYTNLLKGSDLKLGKSNIKEIIKRAIEDTEKFIISQNKEIEIKLDIEDIELNSSPLLSSKAIYNILKNSVEAIKKKGEIKIKGKISDKKYILTISDNGEGIDKKDIEKIFLPFFTTKPDSLGIGLSMVFYLFKKQGWDIEVKSEKNKGTEVIITIPL